MHRSILFASAVVCLAVGAQAQEPAPSPSPQASPLPKLTEYVEVTATRFPENADEVPASIDVVTGQELKDAGASDLGSAIALAAGVVVAPGGDGGPAASVPEFWGLKEFDAFLLVVDGVPWGGAFNPALATLDLNDVERVEVLRGAAPVMYGATSFVGVIHVVRRAAADTLGTVTLNGGSYSSGGGALTYTLPRWAGFESSLALDGGRQGFSDSRTSWQRGHLLWRNHRVVGSGTLRFDVDGTWLDQEPASPHVREGKTLSDRTPLDANHNPDGAFLNEKRVALTAGYDRPAGGGSWSTTLSYTHSGQDLLRGFLSDLDATGNNARGVSETVDVNDLYFDSHLAWTTSRQVKLVAGVDHLHGEGEAKGSSFDYQAALDGSNPPAVPGLSLATPVEIGNRREFSGLYGFLEWNPAEAWRVEAGLRANRTAETKEGDADAPNGGAAQERSDLRLSGSLGLSFTVWQRGQDALRLFGNYRNAFKPAAADFAIGAAEAGEGSILKPETANSYEVGVKGRLLDGALWISASAFLMDFENLVVAQVVNGLPAVENAGSERFKGIEASLRWRVARGLTLAGTYSLHDARFTDYLTEFDGEPTQLGGKRLEMSARHMASGELVYAADHGPLGLLRVAYVGDRFLNKRNSALADPYTTVDASLGWRQPKWEVRLDGRNLGDQRPPVSESELGDAQYYRLPARRADLTLTLRF